MSLSELYRHYMVDRAGNSLSRWASSFFLCARSLSLLPTYSLSLSVCADTGERLTVENGINNGSLTLCVRAFLSNVMSLNLCQPSIKYKRTERCKFFCSPTLENCTCVAWLYTPDILYFENAGNDIVTKCGDGRTVRQEAVALNCKSRAESVNVCVIVCCRENFKNENLVFKIHIFRSFM